MQITSGKAKGYKIQVPRGIPELRPTKSIVRQAIFDILGDIRGIRVLDLYAGSGSLGLEALSRGARWADFVDKDKKACQAIKNNLKHGRFLGKADVFQKTAEDYVANQTPDQYDLILADPPYELDIGFTLNYAVPILKQNGVFIYLHHRGKPTPKTKGLTKKETRQYGLTGVTFLTKEAN